MGKFTLSGTKAEKRAFDRVFDSAIYQSGSMLKALKSEIQMVNEKAENDLSTIEDNLITIGDIVREWVLKCDLLEG